MKRALLISLVACVSCALSEAQAQSVSSSPVQDGKSPSIDYANAKPVPGRIASSAPSTFTDAAALAKLSSSSGFVPGSDAPKSASPKYEAVQLVAPKDLTKSVAPQAISPEQYGTANQPFTTSRVNANGDNTQYYYPYRAAGKLFFLEGTASYVCSASLIKPGVIVTAAHCVANYGKKQFYSNWQFVPAYNNGTAPYGVFTAVKAYVLSSYYNGTDSCAQAGVICQDDVAVIVLKKNANNVLPGNLVGYLGYGWNGYGFTSAGQALISQIGYPVALDSGALEERNDSQGYVSSSYSNNTIIGSLETGGSSGGPWIVNLGMAPSLSGISVGSGANSNVVVGVTSWGYVGTTAALAIKQAAASPFTSTNIVSLVSSACTAYSTYC